MSKGEFCKAQEINFKYSTFYDVVTAFLILQHILILTLEKNFIS